MIQVNLFIGSRYMVNRKRLRETARTVLLRNKVEHVQVDVSIVGSRKMKHLNESKLHHIGSTDVLSFPQHQKNKLDDFPMPPGFAPHLGDIVISMPEAISTSKKFGKLIDDQLCFYLEHGLMHLLGYHHD